jgi:hypothetical protein
MGLSDRALADIGVCRTDVHAAISGMMPVKHIAGTQGSPAWTADIQPLRRPAEVIAASDLRAAVLVTAGPAGSARTPRRLLVG